MAALPSAASVPEAPSGPVVRLLGAWDHWLLSWADRSLTVPASRKDIWLVAGKPSAFADGFAFASWKMERSRGRLTVVIEPYQRLPRGLRPGLEREAADLGRYFEAEAELRIER